MSDPTAGTRRPLRLAYEPALPRQRPPAWVLGVVAAYLLLLTGLLALPAFAAWQGWDIWWWPLGATVAGLMLAWLSLLWLPLRTARHRPATRRRSLWVPILGSGFLAAVLLCGLILAVAEWACPHQSWWKSGSIPAAIAVAGWVVWGAIFWIASEGRPPEAVTGRMTRGLLAGSALELLVAVPVHVVVRRRDDCCAGVATGIGICCGLAVVIVALGPGVVMLYYRRVRQISQRDNV